MDLTVDDWLNILPRLGVKESVARAWAPAFHSEVQTDRFSAGMDDIIEFLPQILHECQMLERTEENLRYSEANIIRVGNSQPAGSRWRSLVPRAAELAYQPEKLAEAAYGGRMGNRPEGSGDGWNFRGRCPIMATGFDAYLWLGNLMGQDLVVMPHLLEGPIYGLNAAVHWWEGRVPDRLLGDLVGLRRKVNGGTLGIKHVADLRELVLEVFA